jgi:hypothetical protein
MPMRTTLQVFNLIGASAPEIVIAAGSTATQVVVRYLGSRIVPAHGAVHVPPVVAETLELEPGDVRIHRVAWNHEAFAAQVGAVELSGAPPFRAYVFDPGATSAPVSSSELIATSFRIPVLPETTSMRVAVTNASDVSTSLTFTNVKTGDVQAPGLVGPGFTYVFDANNEGWSLDRGHLLRVASSQPCVCSVRFARRGASFGMFLLAH